ncbi:MAG: CBS domain-containing protein [Streptosporangiales bacterium]|nr:CBS domain-containing protein [Streptosporangiales bacterium]
MLARELATPIPVVDLDAELFRAARLLTEQQLPGLIVTDDAGRPLGVLPGSQVLGSLLPRYVQEDPCLARVYDEKAADGLCGRLAGFRVRDVMPPKPAELPVVRGDATAVEIAAIMARMHCPLVAVIDGGSMVGAVTAACLLDRIVPAFSPA